LALAAGACFVYRTVSVESVPKPAAGAPAVRVQSPVKAHLADGGTVIYRTGVTIDHDTLHGAGLAYDLRLAALGSVTAVPLSRVLAMENFRGGVSVGATFGISMLATVGVIAGSVAVYCATNPKCFGSCPTAYADSAGTSVLEAEGFSYSIAPAFEMRDVDRLRAHAGPDGTVRLEIRDEALETHYINLLELLEVRHGADETVLPDALRVPIAVRGLRAPLAATDRAGRDVRAALAAHDGVVFQTDSATLARAHADDLDDWVDLELPASPGADSAVIVLRLRNSLLNTVLLYDLMLGDRGAHALDYLAGDLQREGPATQLGRWYAGSMGMRVAVWDGAMWRSAGRIADTGPIAWKDVAIVVPLVASGPLRVRLAFPADNWRIDRVAVAAAARRPTWHTIPLGRVVDSDGRTDSAARASLNAADGRYLQTTAGQRFESWFDAGPEPADSTRTFLLAWQGFYDEWIRQSWLARGRDSSSFTPGSEALADAQRRWRTTQDSTERLFSRTRVPVR
jgi:hypothetical protein